MIRSLFATLTTLWPTVRFTSSPVAMSTSTTLPKILFSDLDGTLVHYPKHFSEYATVIHDDEERAVIQYKESKETRDCVVLQSMTGGKAYISLRTLDLIAKLRAMGVKVVLISGARSSTYASRRAKLPNADFEFFENGGRKLAAGVLDTNWTKSIAPDTPEYTQLVPSQSSPAQRPGVLWQLYKILEEQGWKLDARDYITSFRVHTDVNGKSAELFRNEVVPMLAERGLATSYNLGKADIYPIASGKANAARHVLNLLNMSPSEAVAMFDDDNDLELGVLCGRGFIPGVTHNSVLDAMEHNPHWILTSKPGFLGTESALEEIIELRTKLSTTVAT